MITRTLRRTLLDPRYGVPPTFLLPWCATLTTATTPSNANAESLPPTYQPQTTISDVTRSRPDATTAVASPANVKPLALSESVRELLPVLRAQGQIYINVHIHGKAYLLTQGDTVRLPFLMKDVEAGDVLRLDRALLLGSRDFTLKPSAPANKLRSPTLINTTSHGTPKPESTLPAVSPSGKLVPAPHYVPHIAKGQYSYLDDRLFVCRAVVLGVESEPMRIVEKTKRRQRHVRHIKSKLRFTVLKIKEISVRSLEEIENDALD